MNISRLSAIILTTYILFPVLCHGMEKTDSTLGLRRRHSIPKNEATASDNKNREPEKFRNVAGKHRAQPQQVEAPALLPSQSAPMPKGKPQVTLGLHDNYVTLSI